MIRVTVEDLGNIIDGLERLMDRYELALNEIYGLSPNGSRIKQIALRGLTGDRPKPYLVGDPDSRDD